MLSGIYPWAKLGPRDGARTHWLPLEAHSVDVAQVLKGLVSHPIVRQRLAHASGRHLHDADVDRLAVLACLHDFGKLNHGFQERFDPRKRGCGHIKPTTTVSLCEGKGASDVCAAICGLAGWFDSNVAFGTMIGVILSHHGAPFDPTIPTRQGGQGGFKGSDRWEPVDGMSPAVGIANLIAEARKAFPLCDQAVLPLPSSPEFQHLFAGLLMLADWVASEEKHFPLQPLSDLSRVREAGFYSDVVDKLVRIGWINIAEPDAVNPTVIIGQETLRPLQSAMDEPEGATVLIESETGSGKTEAALLRWLHLRERGVVDSLYFALPTRVAAVEIHKRVQGFVARYLGPQAGNDVLLAVPGYANDPIKGHATTEETPFLVSGEEGSEEAFVWAAQAPKKYLVASIAVGTIDQAMLGVLMTKHAHLRLASLARSLLVVDEVHASDAYMGAIVERLLQSHRALGGHSVLLSATLGGHARSKLLGIPEIQTLEEAVAIPYPGVSWASSGRRDTLGVESAGSSKRVTLTSHPLIDDDVRVADMAVAYASKGAKVLVIRNTVAGAIAVAEALPTGLGFTVRGVETVHHSRFGSCDRRLLDRRASRVLGKNRSDGAMIVVGTQTLEQSLDIDADVLITDLCPIDVLLQRIGRLHRHVRVRPSGFEVPHVDVLAPADLRDHVLAQSRGLGISTHKGVVSGVYRDLVTCSLTLDRIAEGAWTIPADNRRLVETCLHPSAWFARSKELSVDPAWASHSETMKGSYLAQAKSAIDFSFSVSDEFKQWDFDDLHVLTRIGADTRRVELPSGLVGPFGSHPGVLPIPGHWCRGVPVDAVVEDVRQGNGTVFFRFGQHFFNYGRFGLRRDANA